MIQSSSLIDHPGWVTMLGDVNGRCPEDDFVPAWIRLSQPLEVLKHRPVSRHHHLSASRKISINLG